MYSRYVSYSPLCITIRIVFVNDDDIIRLSNTYSCWRLVLHLVRFHCISGEVKVVEGSEFRDM